MINSVIAMELLRLCGISATAPVIVCAYSDTNKYGSSVEDVWRSRDRCHPWRMAKKTKKTSLIARAVAWDKTFHKRMRKRFGLSKYQYLTLTFAKGLVVGYVLAFLFHR